MHPLRIFLTSSMTAHSVLSCTKPGNKIPYPPTNVTTRNTRKPDHYWRWQWRMRWMKWRLLHCRVDLFHTSLLPPTLSRMHQLTTSIPQMSTIHMQSLLSMSTGTPSVWLLRRKMKLVTSTIVLWILFFFYNMHNMLLLTLFHLWSTCIYHKANMHFPYEYLISYLMFYMCFPQGQHILLSI